MPQAVERSGGRAKRELGHALQLDDGSNPDLAARIEDWDVVLCALGLD